MDIHTVDDLDTYLMTNQPTDCPRCQRRTLFEELGDGRERHTCFPCDYAFIVASPQFTGEEQCEHDDCREFTPLDQLNGDGICRACVARGVVYCEECGGHVVAPVDHDHDDEDVD